MKSNESFRVFGDLRARRRLHQSKRQISAPVRHRPPIAPIDMPTAWPDVRLVAAFEPSYVYTNGAPVAAACVDDDLDDGDA